MFLDKKDIILFQFAVTNAGFVGVSRSFWKILHMKGDGDAFHAR
jgi:hypothetical protein